MILHLVILFLLLLVDESLSWTSRIRQHSPRKVTLRMSTKKDGDHSNTKDVGVEGLIGRRRWLGSLTTAATVTIALPSFASNDIPFAFTSKAVCDPTVSVWKKNGRIIYLLGTAHISSSSAALAGQLVRDTSPKGVFVELDPKRVSGSGILSQKLNNESGGSFTRESKVIVPKISAVEGDGGLVLVSSSSSLSSSEDNSSPTTKPAKQNKDDNPIMKVAAAAVGNSIKGLYKRLDSAGFESGEEFVTAVKEGRKISADIILGDRDVELTLRRVTEGLVKTDLKAFLSSDSELERTLEGMALPMNSEVGAKLSGSSDVGKDLTDEQFREELTSFVETMKTKDNVRTVMGQLKRVAPFLYEALVSERDTYMATGLNGLNELESIVAVVGIAHADGIENSLQMNGWEANNLSCGKYR